MTLWQRFMDWWRGEFISRPEVFRRIVAAPGRVSGYVYTQKGRGQ